MKFISGNRQTSEELGTKLQSDLVISSIFFSDIPLDIYKSIRVVPLKHLMYFLAGINTKQFWNILEVKYFAPLRLLFLLIKSFVNPFVEIILTFVNN